MIFWETVWVRKEVAKGDLGLMIYRKRLKRLRNSRESLNAWILKM